MNDMCADYLCWSTYVHAHCTGMGTGTGTDTPKKPVSIQIYI